MMVCFKTLCLRTTPGSFGERARSRSTRTGSCFSIATSRLASQDYWCCAGYDCATRNPRLAGVQGSFGSLLATAMVNVRVSYTHVVKAELEHHG
jgi:hypothetical protein